MFIFFIISLFSLLLLLSSSDSLFPELFSDLSSSESFNFSIEEKHAKVKSQTKSIILFLLSLLSKLKSLVILLNKLFFLSLFFIFLIISHKIFLILLLFFSFINLLIISSFNKSFMHIYLNIIFDLFRISS